MPANVTRILQVIEDPKVEITQIADLIGKDQVLTALVLQMANSALLGYSRNCVSPAVAVMRIGLTRLRSIMLMSSSYQSMNRVLSAYRLGAGELWQHAQNTATASETIARYLHYPNTEEAYVSGLVHDIGKLILNQVMMSDFARIKDFINQYHMRLWEMEKKLIGIDHAQVGSLMAEKWNLPASLAEAIRYHHYPVEATNPILPAIVNLANALTLHRTHPEIGLESGEISPETLTILEIETNTLTAINAQIDAPLNRNR